jgi:hypothetical protein
VDSAGHVVNAGAADRIASATCGLTRQSSPKAWTDCAKRLGFRDVVRIQPANHFWALQAWETAIFLLLAAGLAGYCFWWVRHRTA